MNKLVTVYLKLSLLYYYITLGFNKHLGHVYIFSKIKLKLYLIVILFGEFCSFITRINVPAKHRYVIIKVFLGSVFRFIL